MKLLAISPIKSTIKHEIETFSILIENMNDPLVENFFDYAYVWYRDLYDKIGKPILIMYNEHEKEYYAYFINTTYKVKLNVLLPGYFCLLTGLFDSDD